jgi:hypothetical protein
MNIHVKIVAALHIAFGAMGLIATIVLFTVFGLSGALVASQGERLGAGIVGVVGLCIASLIALLSIPGIVGGCGLIAGKGWARMLVIVLGVLDLLNIPLGTALGIYTLRALLKTEPQPRSAW